MNSKDQSANKNIPLVVDLDGTLLKTDMLFESLNSFVIQRPFSIFMIFIWFFRGKAYLKERLSSYKFDPSTLPYHKGLLDWIRKEKSLGRTVVLATATHQRLAILVAKHFDLFDYVIATIGNLNLKSQNKSDSLVDRFGNAGFDYVGNSIDDIAVWRSARIGYIVSSSDSLISKLSQVTNLGSVFAPECPTIINSLVRALRIHQWIKNLLVLVPLLASFRFADADSVLEAIAAFLVFGLTASSVYILNDLADVADDRHHHRKRSRPFAAGDLSIITGWLMWPLLLITAFGLAAIFLPWAFMVVLAGYFLLTLAYSLGLKQLAMLDVLTLAGLYTSRIVAGAVAISVNQSFWLLTFSVFIFSSLALVKRFSELKVARLNSHEGQIRGRGYQHQDLELVSSMGASAGYLSVLVLALYIQDAHTAELYATPKLIWLACPILLYWISRTWLIAHRGEMHDDPIVFAIKDKVSWIVGACFLGVFIVAKLA